jgi:hypothetical protein
MGLQMRKWRTATVLYLLATCWTHANAQSDSKWGQPDVKSESAALGIKIAFCLRDSDPDDPLDTMLRCVGLSCSGREQYELWTLLDGGARLEGPAELRAGLHSFTAQMAPDEPATAKLKIATSRSAIHSSFLQAIRREKQLRIEAKEFAGATFPLIGFAASFDRMKANCDRM